MNDLLKTAKILMRALESCKGIMKDQETVYWADEILRQARGVVEGESYGKEKATH